MGPHHWGGYSGPHWVAASAPALHRGQGRDAGLQGKSRGEELGVICVFRQKIWISRATYDNEWLDERPGMLSRKAAETIRALETHSPFILYQGDWRDILSKLKERSVDLIISSPPYFTGKAYDRSKRREDFLAEHRELAPEFDRLLKPGGEPLLANRCARRKLVSAPPGLPCS